MSVAIKLKPKLILDAELFRRNGTDIALYYFTCLAINTIALRHFYDFRNQNEIPRLRLKIWWDYNGRTLIKE